MKLKTGDSYNAFQKWGVVTVFFVYLLIAVGGVVRSTGAGMGCPDWPKCFGSWVPPTKISQLPADYRETYAEKRKQKNEKLADYLDRLGFAALGQRIHNDTSVYVEQDFNATKTWIEYLNRLLGALVGIFIFATALLSVRYWNKDRTVTLYSLLSVVLVGLQAWLGSVVVSTNLLTGIITVHMVVAIIIVFVLLYALVRSLNRTKNNVFLPNKRRINFVLLLTLSLSLIQIILGTQVRQAIDWISDALPLARSEWIGRLGWEFYAHRSFSSVILVANLYLLWLVHKNVIRKSVRTWAKALVAVLVSEIIAGICMAYFSIPAFLQPVHLLLAVVAIGIQFVIWLLLNPVRQGGLASEKHTVSQNAVSHGKAA